MGAYVTTWDMFTVVQGVPMINCVYTRKLLTSYNRNGAKALTYIINNNKHNFEVIS